MGFHKQKEKSRPIIFIGHSTGCSLIIQALINAKRTNNLEVFSCTRALFFYGAGHLGMDNTANREMVQDLSQGEFSSRLSLLDDFKKLSNFIVTQREDIVNLWERDRTVKIVSFYETQQTHVVERNPQGEWVTGNKQVQVVRKGDAQLYLPSETRIPTTRTHYNIVKFEIEQDSVYQSTKTHMKTCLKAIFEQKLTNQKQKPKTKTKPLTAKK
jgi:hypothetical protein